jgi:hypothetical protein
VSVWESSFTFQYITFVFQLFGQVTLLLDLLNVIKHLVDSSILFLTSYHIKFINISLVDSYRFQFSSLTSILLLYLVLFSFRNLLHVLDHEFLGMLRGRFVDEVHFLTSLFTGKERFISLDRDELIGL